MSESKSDINLTLWKHHEHYESGQMMHGKNAHVHLQSSLYYCSVSLSIRKARCFGWISGLWSSRTSQLPPASFLSRTPLDIQQGNITLYGACLVLSFTLESFHSFSLSHARTSLEVRKEPLHLPGRCFLCLRISSFIFLFSLLLFNFSHSVNSFQESFIGMNGMTTLLPIPTQTYTYKRKRQFVEQNWNVLTK